MNSSNRGRFARACVTSGSRWRRPSKAIALAPSAYQIELRHQVPGAPDPNRTQECDHDGSDRCALPRSGKSPRRNSGIADEFVPVADRRSPRTRPSASAVKDTKQRSAADVSVISVTQQTTDLVLRIAARAGGATARRPRESRRSADDDARHGTSRAPFPVVSLPPAADRLQSAAQVRSLHRDSAARRASHGKAFRQLGAIARGRGHGIRSKRTSRTVRSRIPRPWQPA